MEQLKSEILDLEAKINIKRQEFFKYRFKQLYPDYLNQNVQNINIKTKSGNWEIKYKHFTEKYTFNNYLLEDESDDPDDQPIQKTSHIKFGKNNTEYYIKGSIVDYKIYRNSKGNLRVINTEYDFDLDLDEQKNLIVRYAINKDIPEAIALSIFIYMIDNQWDDQSMYIYLTELG